MRLMVTGFISRAAFVLRHAILLAWAWTRKPAVSESYFFLHNSYFLLLTFPPVQEWLLRIEQNLVTRCRLKDGQSLLAGVSGGIDSMVLLHLLSILAPAHQWKVVVGHFNHQLRGRQSEADD